MSQRRNIDVYILIIRLMFFYKNSEAFGFIVCSFCKRDENIVVYIKIFKDSQVLFCEILNSKKTLNLNANKPHNIAVCTAFITIFTPHRVTTKAWSVKILIELMYKKKYRTSFRV